MFPRQGISGTVSPCAMDTWSFLRCDWGLSLPRSLGEPTLGLGCGWWAVTRHCSLLGSRGWSYLPG